MTDIEAKVIKFVVSTIVIMSLFAGGLMEYVKLERYKLCMNVTKDMDKCR